MTISRRRFLLVAAAAAGLPRAAAAAVRPVEWRGVALGAPARLVLHHPDRAAALALLRDCRAEIERLENIFSLYRPGSSLVRLNRDGRLAAPPLDLVRCLGEALRMAALSRGAFDPSVQPLWALYARHFAAPDADPAGPSAADIAAARARVDWRKVGLAPSAITLAPGMALTLNGIAQGYASDRVAELLRSRGAGTVLVHLGETRGLGRPADGGWRVGLPDGRVMELSGDAAVATSSPDGTRFSPVCHHLFDPATGRSAVAASEVTVRAPTAALADALSTTLAVAPALRQRLRALVAGWEAI